MGVDPGVISLRVDSQAYRDLAGRNAVKDEPDQFPPDLQYCFDRLEEIRGEIGVLYSKMYASKMTAKNRWGETDMPPYQVRIAIQQEIRTLELEESVTMSRIEELKWILPVNDQDGDAEEDEEEKGDMTQPEAFEQEVDGHLVLK